MDNSHIPQRYNTRLKTVPCRRTICYQVQLLQQILQFQNHMFQSIQSIIPIFRSAFRPPGLLGIISSFPFVFTGQYIMWSLQQEKNSDQQACHLFLTIIFIQSSSFIQSVNLYMGYRASFALQSPFLPSISYLHLFFIANIEIAFCD